MNTDLPTQKLGTKADIYLEVIITYLFHFSGFTVNLAWGIVIITPVLKVTKWRVRLVK